MQRMTKLRISFWFPVFLWLMFIFFLSSLTGEKLSSISVMILSFINSHNNHIFTLSSDQFHFLGHRIAHIVEYSMLGILVLRAYSLERVKITIIVIFILAFFIFICGSLDEWHQSFVAGRSAQFLDAMFDTICGTLGILGYKMIVLSKRHLP